MPFFRMELYKLIWVF